MDWIKEIEFEDLLEKDSRLIFEHCKLETLLDLWENLPGITLYLSERDLFKARKRYIRKYFDKNDESRNAKALAVKLGVSEKFVYEALNTTDEKDDRQARLL
jgi:Mor family transcriptional regulator